MITVKILGGLGNQLFQYAFGRCLSILNDTGLCLDYYHQMIRTDFEGEKLTKITDVFDLPVKLYIGKTRKVLVSRFGLKYADRLLSKIYRMTRYVVDENEVLQRREQIRRQRDMYITGYWQSENYFAEIEDVIRRDYRFKAEEQLKSLDIYKEISGNNSVSLHIRGKDYLTKSIYARCDVGYYMDAAEMIARTDPDPKFYIFTDDIDNVHQNYKELLRFSKVVDVKTPFSPDAVDLLLMSKCRHNVICNSSFSWWGAWLNDNPDKIVIAPRRWFSDPEYYNEEILVPKKWRRI